MNNFNTSTFVDLDSLSIEDLEELRDSLPKNEYNNAHLEMINNKIKEKEIRNINEQFDFNTFNVIPKTEKDILELNGITNLQQLIDANLDELRDQTGRFIGQHTKEYLSWARTVYDMKNLNINKDKETSNHKKTDGKKAMVKKSSK